MDCDQAVKTIHSMFLKENATYNEALWVLHMMTKTYAEKGTHLLNSAKIEKVGKVKTDMKERLF